MLRKAKMRQRKSGGSLHTSVMLAALMFTGQWTAQFSGVSANANIQICEINYSNTECNASETTGYDPASMDGNLILSPAWNYGESGCVEEDYTFRCSQTTTGASSTPINLCTTQSTSTGEFDTESGTLRLGTSVPTNLSMYRIVIRAENKATGNVDATCTFNIEPKSTDPCLSVTLTPNDSASHLISPTDYVYHIGDTTATVIDYSMLAATQDPQIACGDIRVWFYQKRNGQSRATG